MAIDIKQLETIIANAATSGVYVTPQILEEIFSKIDNVNAALDKSIVEQQRLFTDYCNVSNPTVTPLTATLGLSLIHLKTSYENLIINLLDRGATLSITDLYILTCYSQSMDMYSLVWPRMASRFLGNIKEILDDNNNNILHKLANSSSFSREILQFVLSQNIDINEVNAEGNTALQIALLRRNYQFADILLQHGAKTTLPNNNRKTAQDIIGEKYNEEGRVIEQVYQWLQAESMLQECVTDASIFQQAIESFSREFKVNIEGLFAQNQARFYLVCAFFASKRISNFLARESITFAANDNPELNKLETKIYQAASMLVAESKNSPEKKIVDICYRVYSPTFFPNATFYLKGTDPHTNQIYLKLIRDSLPDLTSSYIELILPWNIFVIGEKLKEAMGNKMAVTNERGFRYIISATLRDHHIFTTLSVLNMNSHKIDAHIFCNSWKEESYFKRMKNDITFSEKDNEKAPVFDASMNIQTEGDDNNCSLYTVQICHAMYQALSTNEDLQKLLEGLSKENDSMKKWNTEVCAIFQKHIQANLPEFFEKRDNDSFELKPYKQLKAEHLQLKWQAGNIFIKNTQKTCSARIQEEHSSWENIKNSIAMTL